MLRRFAVAVVLIAASTSALAATQGGPIPVPLPLFPPNNWWNTDISQAPVDANSANFIAFINALVAPLSRSLHPDFGGDSGDPDFPIYGFPYIIVDGSQTKLAVTFGPDAIDESDGVNHMTNQALPFYPIPSEAASMTGWVEGGAPGSVNQRADADRHILIVDKTNNALYELYNVWYDGTVWEAYSGAFFDMNTNNRRTEGWTSADAGGLAILPGLVRYDEVSGPNEIGHAFRVTVRLTNGHVYPASHTAGSTAGALPMGARLRLKASVNISGYSADIQKIFRAFKKYGLIVADNGSDMYISGNYDTHWDNGVLNPAFASLHADDFEVVQLGWQPSVNFILDIPTTLRAGDAASATLTAYDSNYNVATGYTGTVHFTCTDTNGAVVLPVNYTFNVGDAGTHSFPGGFTLWTTGGQTIAVTDLADATITGSRNVIVGPATPTGLSAAATSSMNVNLSWNPAAGAAQYEVMRTSAGSPYATLTTTASTSYGDGSVSGGATYVYKVRAIDASSRPSPFSVPDAATTLFFTDDPLVAGVTVIKAMHITEVRTAVNAMRAAAGLGAASFTDASPGGVTVKAVHLQELRTALDAARTALGLPAIAYADGTLTAGTTIVKAAHVQDLRAGVK